MATRTIIYCQTIKQCAVDSTLKTLIKFMLTHRTKIQKEWFLKCYILAAPSEIKISFLGHFSVMSKDTSTFLLQQIAIGMVLIARSIGQSVILARPKM